MAANTAPERVVWAVEMLDVAPDDQLLEIALRASFANGCGAGHAVSLICARLDTGAITAIDRSALMISLALQRNHRHVVVGKARLEAVALAVGPAATTRSSTQSPCRYRGALLCPDTEICAVLVASKGVRCQLAKRSRRRSPAMRAIGSRRRGRPTGTSAWES